MIPNNTVPQQPPKRDLDPTLLNIRYKECVKNHAASIGGHVTDGCGEFMPSGEQNTPQHFICAACHCHRSFHRKQIHPIRLLTPSTEDINMFYYNNNDDGLQLSTKKRSRTKFTQQQKDRMMEFAQKIGWKLQKQHEEEVDKFCCQLGFKTQVFKVWMHNSKQAMKKIKTGS